MSAHGNVPLQTFHLTNDIKEIDPQDAIFKHDKAYNTQINNEAPWKNDPHWFKSCKISAIALIKMVIHARSGGVYEIMGLMQGRVQGDCLVILDSFALPVQGTETRVNAGDAAFEYMAQYNDSSEKAGRQENVIGWYHSHPGYGCWLSGIDVSTQSHNQKFQDPFVAVVIDPNRTVSAGKVEIGAFRTYPEGYKPPNSSSDYQSIPLEKIEDFGVHADSYYPIPISIFKSKLDDELLSLLWNKYWVNTLSQTPLISNRAYAASQLADLQAKMTKATSAVSSRGTGISATATAVLENLLPAAVDKAKGGKDKKKDDNALEQVVRDSTRISSEAQHGLIAQVIKDVIFSTRPKADGSSEPVETKLAPVLDTAML
ncbi:Mov34-domain-containing protein [Clavulina sp. PMI_390]|nr:Mov34-domain-containing protein [Clavulina sp. PMI_390]